MHRSGWILFASGLWLASTSLVLDGRAGQPVCGRHLGYMCRTGSVAAPRRPYDVYLGQRRHSLRGLRRARPLTDVYLSQTLYGSVAPYHRHRRDPSRGRRSAWHVPQIPPPFRFAGPQPWPEFITRPCGTRFADPLGCARLRLPSDPFVDALLETPSARTFSTLRALGLPIIVNVPPIVTLNDDGKSK